MKKRLLLLITTVLIISGFIFIFAYSIFPKVKFTEDDNNRETFNYIIGKEVLGSLGKIISEKKMEFDFNFTERELNDILYWQVEKLNSSNNKIKGLHCKIDNGNIIFYVDTDILSMPTQFVIKSKVDINEHKLSIKLDDMNMGSLKLPKGWALSFIEKNFKNIKVDKKKGIIEISLKLPKQLIISDFNVGDEVRFKLLVSVNSKWDFISIATYLYPKDYKDIIKDFIFD
ncbi:hypothetical protein [Clostridium thermarum]|uniref:hypothetical protein n=1 Tax=Clostridium thermarum TaxID=1716543 RepID=UPI0013D3C6A1|nr:hypothetical protein [Clostridium thermarum]